MIVMLHPPRALPGSSTKAEAVSSGVPSPVTQTPPKFSSSKAAQDAPASKVPTAPGRPGLSQNSRAAASSPSYFDPTEVLVLEGGAGRARLEGAHGAGEAGIVAELAGGSLVALVL